MMRKPIQSTSKVSLEPTSYSVLQYHIVLCQGSASLGAVHPAAFHCLDDCAAAASPPRPSDLDPRTRSSQSEAHKVVQCDSCYTLLIFIVQFCPTLILIILMPKVPKSWRRSAQALMTSMASGNLLCSRLGTFTGNCRSYSE